MQAPRSYIGPPPDRAENANFPASRRHFRLKMNCHGFPEACDHKYLFDHRLDRFDHRPDRCGHRLSKRCPAPGCINTLADWSTFTAAGTVPNSDPHSRACIKSNTHSYADSEPDTITKRSTCWNASPTFAPPQITLHPVQVIRVCDAAGNVIESHEQKGEFKEWRDLTKSRHAVKHDGPLLQLIDRLSDCLARFAARAYSVPIERSLSEVGPLSQQGQPRNPCAAWQPSLPTSQLCCALSGIH